MINSPDVGGTNGGTSKGRFDRPILIVSTPRSGSTLLFETLEQAPGLYTTGNESHGLIESVPGLSPMDHGWNSNRLVADDATPQAVERLAAGFLHCLTDRNGRPPEGRFRMLEKTPKNALRVPFFNTAFPDAMFVFLYRDARQTLSSMIEAWLSGRFRTYPKLEGWPGYPWSLLLVPGWRDLGGQALPQVVANQWAITMNQLLDDLEAIPGDRLRAVHYEQFLESPNNVIPSLAASLDLHWDRPLGKALPLSKTTVSRPDKEKWRQIEDVIKAVLPIIADADRRAHAFIERLNRKNIA